MNEKTIIDKRIELVDEAKFIDSSSENKIYERQYMIFTIIASFSLHIRYNNLLKKFELLA